MLEKNPDKDAAMEKTRLHLQKSLVRVHARGTIFPVLNADSVASRYPTKDHSERHDYPDDQCNYPFHFSLPLWRHRQA
jgi:hypothetical protein